MTFLRSLVPLSMMCLVASFQACSQETTDPVTHDPVMSTSIRGPAFPRGLQFSADGATVWINSLDAWSVDTGKRLLRSPLFSNTISSPIIDFTSQPRLIAGRESGDLLLWQANEPPKVRKLSQSGQVSTARLLDQGKRFALVFLNPPSVYFGDVDADQDDAITPLPFKASRCKLAPNGTLLAIRDEREIKIWDLKRNEERVILKHEHKLFACVFSADSRLLATGSSNDNLVRIFDTEDGELLAELSGHGRGSLFLTSAVYCLAFSPNGKRLASGGHDGRVIVWDVEAHEPIMKVQIEGPPIVSAVAFSPDSQLVACAFENAGANRGIRVWRIPNQNSNR